MTQQKWKKDKVRGERERDKWSERNLFLRIFLVICT